MRNLEESGFKVIVITGDGASPKRNFFKMHTTSNQEEVTYKTKNPYSEDGKEIFFMSDVPHLMKTTRNCWLNSFGHSQMRALWVSIHAACVFPHHATGWVILLEFRQTTMKGMSLKPKLISCL